MLLAGCASSATLLNLEDAERACAAGYSGACANVPILQNQASSERAMTVLLPVFAVGAVALVAAAPPPPDYIVLVPCRRSWRC